MERKGRKQSQKFSCNEILVDASADPFGSFEEGMSLPSCPELG